MKRAVGNSGYLVSDEHDYNAAKALHNCTHVSISPLREQTLDQPHTKCRGYIAEKKMRQSSGRGYLAGLGLACDLRGRGALSATWEIEVRGAGETWWKLKVAR